MISRSFAAAAVFLMLAGVSNAFAATTLDHEFRFDPGQLKLTPSGDYTEVSVRGGMREFRAGRPDLPWMGQRVDLPEGMRIASIQVLELKTEPLSARVRVASAEVPQPGLGTVERSAPDPAFFSSTMQPSAPVELGPQGSQRGTSVATLRVCPVRWNPGSGSLERVTSIRVRLTLEPGEEPLARERVVPEWEAPGPDGATAAPVVRRARTLAARTVETLSGRTAQPFKATQIPSVEGSPVQYVIVTEDEQAAEFQRLADWKTQSGVPAVVRTVSFIKQEYPFGSDDAERIRMFLRDAYTRWGTKFVLLGGDTDVLPTRFPYTLFYGGNYIASDLYYSCLDGNWNADGDSLYGEGYYSEAQSGDAVDLFPDVYVGRSPTVNAAQAKMFVDKTLFYEQTPVGDYEKTLLFFAEVLFPQDWVPFQPTSLDGAELVEDVLPTLQANPALHYARLYENYTYSGYEPGALLETVQSVKDSLDRGYNVAVHVGHGYRNVMSVGNGDLTNADAIAMTNGNRLTNLYAINCTSNAIDFPSIGEAFLHAPNGGAVTNIGSTNLDFPTAGRSYQDRYFTLLYTDSVTAIGEAQAEAKVQFIPFSSYDGVNRWTQMTLLLLGDPELRVWTGTPRTLTVTHNPTMSASDTTFSVNVAIGGTPLYNARVTAYKAGVDLKSALTDGAGNVVLPFRPDSVGSFQLTVTGFDCRPYRATVNLTASALPVLEADAVTIDDDAVGGTSGNANGLVDAGETIDLRVRVDNNGGSTANGVNGVLATTDGTITIGTPTCAYGTVATGGSVVPAGAFRITVPATTPDQREVPFTLTLTDGFGRRWVRAVRFTVRAPELVHYGQVVSDQGGNFDGRPDPGETVFYYLKLRNNGTGIARGITARLRSYDGLATVSDSAATWGDIAPQQEVQADAVVFSPSSPSARLELRVSGPSGLLWTKMLDLSFPLTPSQTVGVGASSSIRLQWHRSESSDLLGYCVYRSSTSGGALTRVNPVPTERTAYFLDEGLAGLTRYYYKITAVDSSGNESGLSSEISASTNPPHHSVFPIAMARETPSSVAVDHLYPGYPMSIVAGSDVLYLWNPDGSTPVDADGASSTSGDFTRRGSYYAAAPAIGDLNGDGTPEITGASWDSLRVYTFDLAGNVRPGWPLVTSDPVWSAPALGDLDNNGTREIVFASNGTKFYAMKEDGTEWMDGDANASTKGVFKILGDAYNFGTPAIADLDGNGVRDIVFGSFDGYVYAWRPNGTNLPGFPYFIGGNITASPAIGYLDGPGDTQLDIVVGSSNDSLHVIKADGGRHAGFPVRVNMHGNSKTPSPALADMNQDGVLDIVQASNNGAIYVYKNDGTLLPNWNGARYSPLGSAASEASPAVADINGDGWNDVVMGDETGQLSALSGINASMMPGFPIQLAGEIRGAPALCDLDGDGLTEIVLSGWDKNVYVWDYDFPFSPGGKPPWPQFHHDAMRTGFASNAVFVAVGDPPVVDAAPSELQFAPPTPNPSRGGSRVRYAVPATAAGQPFEIAVFDLSGRRVATLARGAAQAGPHSVAWDLRDSSGARVGDGIYFLNLRLGDASRSHKLIVIR